MKFIIALIGCENTGKSSFFNILTKSKSALIDKNPGTTIDRNYGSFYIKNEIFYLVDTAGINIKKNSSLEKKKYFQTIKAIKEAQLIFFMTDLKIGLTKIDFLIINIIRKENKKIFLLINKIDCKNYIKNLWEFYDLGIKETYEISVAHSIGIFFLKNKIFDFFQNYKYNSFKKEIDNNKKNIIFKDKNKFKIFFVGAPNVGKSTLINKILKKKRVITQSQEGTTKGITNIDFFYKNKNYYLIDSAGLKKKPINNFLDYVSKKKILNTIKISEITVFILDANHIISNRKLQIFKKLSFFARSFFILISKWDLIVDQKKKNVKNLILKRLHFLKNKKIIFISALKNFNLKNFFNVINKVYNNSIKNFSSTSLTKMVREAVKKQPMPMDITGKLVKLKYVHLGGKNPYIFIIHGTKTENLSHSYKKYLINYLEKKLNIFGTNIKLFFKNSKNPYHNKKISF